MTDKRHILIPTALALLALLAAGCSLLPFRKAEKTPKVRIEMRFAESTPRDTFKAIKIYGAKTTVYVGPDKQFTNQDIVEAATETGAGIMQTPIIILTLTEDATQRLADITANRYNSPLAVIFNDKAMAVLTGDEIITSGRIIFTGRFTKKEAEEFVKQINSDIPVPVSTQKPAP